MDLTLLNLEVFKMARKTRELRLSQAQALHDMYTGANLTDDFRYSFICDMISRLSRNTSTSTKQRNWIDSLIEEGVPAPKGDPVLLARIEAAQAVTGMKEYDINILSEFAGKIRRGWDLSEKQTTWMSKLLTEADRLVEEGPFTIDEEITEKLRLCLRLAKGYSSTYWATHGGTYKALASVEAHLAGTSTTDEWCVNKLMVSMAGRLREVTETPYVSPGRPCWVRVRNEDTNFGHNMYNWDLGVVAGSPEVDEHGRIVYPVLTATGSLQMATQDELAKRNPNK